MTLNYYKFPIHAMVYSHSNNEHTLKLELKRKKKGSVLSHYENELLTHSILKHNQKGHFGPKPLFDRSHPTTEDGKKAANLFWFGHHPTPKHPTILILQLFLLWYLHFG